MARTLRVAVSSAGIAAALAFFSLQGDTKEIAGAKLAFEIAVEAPSLISFCKNSLWAYSPPSHTLSRLNPETGAKLSDSVLRFIIPGMPIQSMTCWSDLLLISDRAFIHRVELDAHGPVEVNRYVAPTPELKGLHCEGETCIALGETAMKSTDLIHWTAFALAQSKDIEPVQNHSKENPFWNWHEQFQLSKSRYSKSASGPTGQLFLLDALRSAIVSVGNEGSPHPVRWGTFGHFEGTLTYPRGIAVLKSGDLAVSDTGLKLIFVFSPEGEYKGFIASDAKDGRFGYPVDLAVHGDMLYVADFGEHKVSAFDLSKAQWKPGPKPTTVDELLVGDLLQHPAVQKTLESTRCLSCHDGTEVNSLESFGKMHFHHPVGVVLKPEMLVRKIDLPLGPGNTVSCNSCHDGHHETHSGQLVSPEGRITHVQELPFKLRKSERQLCASCHFDHNDRAHNHIDLVAKHDGTASHVISCEQCHQAHGSFEKMLGSGVPGTCLNCHKGQADHVHEHAEKFTPNDCLSCHALHQGKTRAFLIDGESSGAGTCVGCHKEFHSFLESNAHMESKAGQAACLSCHQPHQTKANGPELCISCHKDRNQLHHALIATADTDRAQGVHLSHEHVTCVTCHEPHGKTGLAKYLRPREPLIQFCSSCHGAKTPDLFDQYHLRISR